MIFFWLQVHDTLVLMLIFRREFNADSRVLIFNHIRTVFQADQIMQSLLKEILIRTNKQKEWN